MTRYLNLDDAESLKGHCDARAADLFNARDDLEILRLRNGRDGTDDEKDGFWVASREYVINIKQLQDLNSDSKDELQIFFIRQDRSWTTLNITRNLFEDVLSMFQVFLPFWRCAFTFGRKLKENNFEFPPFHFRWSPKEAFECTYVLRRVELHNRTPAEGQGLWSIRQSAVYHKSDLSGAKPDRFIIIAPSERSEDMLEQSIEFATEESQPLVPFNIHRLLIADSLKNWQEYLASLEAKLRDQSDQAVLAKVGAEKDRENMPPHMDFNINFLDRQKLKQLKDSVIDAQVIFYSIINYTKGIQAQAKRYCEYLHLSSGIKCDCISILDEFDLHIAEVEIYIKRTSMLNDRAEATAKLLSDILHYEEAVALKKLGNESQKETVAMYSLTEQSTKDAAAVKILTIIALIYLPTTIVANFFSTQFVHSDDDGNLQISSRAWMLAAFAIPLTAITVAIWWVWVRFFTEVKTSMTQEINITRINRLDSFRSVFSKRKRQNSDLEAGSNASPTSPQPLMALVPIRETYSGGQAHQKAFGQDFLPGGTFAYPLSAKNE
ncbi:hypothetical protein BGZ60DRAFT_423072 [Tricladium varicosporioides]|nr:hypothetical protein BGZ60DRAFT_423072 [Hymenoscyphus varicosporioides]